MQLSGRPFALAPAPTAVAGKTGSFLLLLHWPSITVDWLLSGFAVLSWTKLGFTIGYSPSPMALDGFDRPLPLSTSIACGLNG